MRRYAEETSVSVGKSRGEIDDLLRAWNCSGIGWLDDFEHGTVTLQFRWTRDDLTYLAQFRIHLPDDTDIRKQSLDLRSRCFSQSKYEKAKASHGRHQHRVLALWIKAALNAVEAGIVEPAVIFLPFLVGNDGRTFGDVALPRLPQLLQGRADRLLPGPGDNQ